MSGPRRMLDKKEWSIAQVGKLLQGTANVVAKFQWPLWPDWPMVPPGLDAFQNLQTSLEQLQSVSR